MSGMTLTFTFDDDRVQAALSSLDDAVADATSAFDEIGDMLVAGVIRRFETGVGPDGVAWKPSERALKEGGKTLVKAGHLRNSYTHRPEPQQVLVGTNIVYASVHQNGGVIEQQGRRQTLAFNNRGRFTSRANASRRRSGSVRVAFAETFAFSYRMPARPMLGIEPAEREEANLIMGAYLLQRARGSAP